jgi:heparosan-N-sulfate-glucuronate 5-epimerase
MKASKLKYGINRLFEEIIGKEDYWHVATPYRNKNALDISTYPLDLTKKANYPFEIKNNIPVVTINNVPTEIATTILFFGLGLIDTGYRKNTDTLSSIIKWLTDHQENDGSWKINYADKTYHLESGWYSGMVQGLAISFFIRTVNLKLIDETKGKQIIEKALDFMLSGKTISIYKDCKIIDEYGSTNTCVLNGFIFSLISLWDYGVFKNDFSLFQTYENSLNNILKKYHYGLWSYYDIKRIIASSYYHRLHINMLTWLNTVAPDDIYKSSLKKWKRGLYFKAFYILAKAFQKFFNLSKIDTLDTK